jgi:hypothetical protein
MALSMDALVRIITQADLKGANAAAKGLQQVQKAGQDVNKGLGGIGNILGSITGGVVALGAGISAAGLMAFAKSSIDAADNMRDLSQKTGASVENLSRLELVAKQSGTTLEAVGGAMVKLSKGMNEAATTGKGPAAEALQRLGISAVDASGKLLGADEVMLRVADRFQQMPDGATKAALAVQLFGRAGAEMIPMLNGGRQAIESLDASMTTAFANKADAYNDSLAAMGRVFGQIGMAIADELLPYLSNAVDWLTKVGLGMRDWIIANKEPIRQTIETIGGVAKALTPWVIGIGLVVGAYKLLIEAVKAAAIAQAALAALSGPAGWAKLALAAGLTAGAVWGINEATKAAGGSAAAAALDAQKLAAGMSGAAAAAGEVPPEVENAKQQQEAFNAAVEQSNAYYKLLGATIDATSQAVQRQGQLRDATLTADIAVNNAAKSILEVKLSQTKSDAEKIPILRQIMGIELENARLQKAAADEQIRQEVQITDLKRRKAWEELRSAEAALATAAAYGQQTEKLQEQVNLMKVAANSADADYRLQQKIATQKGRANDAQFKAQQAQILGRQMPGLSAVGSGTGQFINGAPVLSDGRTGMKINGVLTYAGGGYTGDGPRTGGLDGRGGFMAMLHPRETVIDHAKQGAAGTPTINITTGPVYRLPDGTDTVSMADLERAMRATAAGVMGQLRTPAGRVALGGA